MRKKLVYPFVNYGTLHNDFVDDLVHKILKNKLENQEHIILQDLIRMQQQEIESLRYQVKLLRRLNNAK